MAGVGAGITEAILVVTPQETLKTKLIHDRFLEKPQYNGLFDGINKIYAAKGFNGIYRGVIPTILRQGSNQGVRFLVYDESKKLVCVRNNIGNLKRQTRNKCQYLVFAYFLGGRATIQYTTIDSYNLTKRIRYAHLI